MSWHTVPFPMFEAETQDKLDRGGWVSPCPISIQDQKVICGLNDIPYYCRNWPHDFSQGLTAKHFFLQRTDNLSHHE